MNALKCFVVLAAISAAAVLDAAVSDSSAFAAAMDSNNAPAAASGNQAPPEKVAPNTATAPGVMAPKPTPDAGQIGGKNSDAPSTSPGGSGGQKGNLSDKLNSTNGVIRPKGNVDPGIEKPAPAAGSMPIVRPPSADSNAQNRNRSGF